MRSTARVRSASAPTKRVVILGFPPVDALDVVGPAEVFALANDLRGEEYPAYRVELIGVGASRYLSSDAGIGLVGHKTLAQERRGSPPIDTLIVTAGLRSIDTLDRAAIAWLRQRASTARRVCSICVGAFALAETGLLDHRRVTTHWRMAQRLAESYPDVRVDPAPIWVKDGKFYTSAGITSGIDLALSLIAEDFGDRLALAISKTLVLFLRRPGGQAQFSVALSSQRASSPTLRELCDWITGQLQNDLTIEALADHISISVRSVIRIFRRELNTTPARYVEDIRLEAVRRALELGTQSLKQIAGQCGYRSLDVMRKAFLRRIGVSPNEYARRFSSLGDGNLRHPAL